MLDVKAPHLPEDLFALHKAMCVRGLEILEKKNSDYNNPNPKDGCLRGFKRFGAYGILVRLSDKLERLVSFVEKAEQGKKLEVVDESWEDTVIDAINYLVILDGYIRAHGPVG